MRTRDVSRDMRTIATSGPRWLGTALLGLVAACATAEAPMAGAPAAPPPMTPTPTTTPTTTPEPIRPEPAPTQPAPAPLLVTPEPATPSPRPHGPYPRRPYPEGAIAIRCTLHAEVEPTLRGGELRLRFVLVNDAPDPVTVTLRGTCPGGMVELRGLPSTFDPMHRCQAGACVSPTATATYTVPGRKRVTIGETTLRAKGDACNPPLPLGSTYLSAAIVTDPPVFEACSGSSIHIVRDPKSGALRRAGAHEPRVPAAPSKPQPKPRIKPEPKRPEPKPRPKNCRACAFACPNGIPSTKPGPDGCPSCTCEKYGPLRP